MQFKQYFPLCREEHFFNNKSMAVFITSLTTVESLRIDCLNEIRVILSTESDQELEDAINSYFRNNREVIAEAIQSCLDEDLYYPVMYFKFS